MLADRKKLKELGLEKFSRDFDNVENQYLNLIYDERFDNVVEKWVYDKTSGLLKWNCAICDSEMFADKNRIDIENFVCENCRHRYNNGNMIVDMRILNSRTRFFKYIEDRLYEQLEYSLTRVEK